MRTKKDRNERLYKFWLEHPGWTYQSIANQFRISKPRAWLIIQQEYKKLGFVLGNLAEAATITSDKPLGVFERHQDGKLARFRAWLRDCIRR